jgi:hypothetical protein
MKPVVPSFVFSAVVGLLMAGHAQAAAPAPGRVDVPRMQEETVCIGPGSITGTVVDATTIITPRFSGYKCWSHSPMPIAVQFKDPSAALKVGDTVTLKGRLIYLLDARRDKYGFVLKNAEIAQ